MDWTSIWMNLFGTTSFCGIDMGFWMAMAVVLLSMREGLAKIIYWIFCKHKERDMFEVRVDTENPEIHKDHKDIISLILRSFQEGTDYSDGTDIIALIEEIRIKRFHYK